MLIGLYFVIGVALDTAFYPFIIRWQPPWLTFMLAVGEFILVYIAAKTLKGIHFNVGPRADPRVLGRVVIAIWTKVVILPLLSLSWIENAGEFRSDWLVGCARVPAAPDDRVHPRRWKAGRRRWPAKFSAAVIEIPEELRRAPSPSGVHRVPTGPPPSSGVPT